MFYDNVDKETIDRISNAYYFNYHQSFSFGALLTFLVKAEENNAEKVAADLKEIVVGVEDDVLEGIAFLATTNELNYDEITDSLYDLFADPEEAKEQDDDIDP